jgi:hypothetical protein
LKYCHYKNGSECCIKKITNFHIRFVQPKGFLTLSKYAMDVVVEQVEKKVEEVVDKLEEKIVELAPKVEEKVVELTDVVLDKTQTVVEDTTKKVSDEIVAAVESNAVVQKIEALIDSNPELKAISDKLEAALVKEVDGRVFTCWCCCWWWSLKLTRQDPRKVPATSSPSTSVVQPLPSVQVPEWSPPKVVAPSSSWCCGQKSVV